MTGEVAVRENGGVTAVEADSLDGNVSVDLDHDPPMVGVPEETAVVYEADELEATDADEAVATDGGFVRDRVTMRQYGLGLSSGNRNIILTVMAFAYAAAGYLVGVGEGTAAIVTFAAAAAVTFFLQYRRPDRD